MGHSEVNSRLWRGIRHRALRDQCVGGGHTCGAVSHNVSFRLPVRRNRAGRESPGSARERANRAEVSGHTSGPVGHNMFSDCQGNEAAQEGITGGSEDSEDGADGLAEEGAASDAGAVGDDVAEFDGAAGGEMLAGLHEDAQEKH
jgi:hypothetical protein